MHVDRRTFIALARTPRVEGGDSIARFPNIKLQGHGRIERASYERVSNLSR